MNELQLDQLKFISETHRTAMDARRGFEWKTVIGSVTFFVLTAAAASEGKFPLPKVDCVVWWVWGIAYGLAILSCCYLFAIHMRNDVNKAIAEAAEDAIVATCGVKEVQDALANVGRGRSKGRSQKPWSKFWSRYWAFVWQTSLIFAFASTSAYVISSIPKSSPTQSVEKCVG